MITERLGRLLLIGINRPQQHNVIDRVTAHQLTHLMREQFEADPNILAGVLYGCGEDFCTGLDCEELADSKGTCLELYGLDENKDTGPMVNHLHQSEIWFRAIFEKLFPKTFEIN